MPSTALFVVYMTVMGAALGCFWRAFFVRRFTPIHKRWGITGVALDLGGTAAVLVAGKILGWHVDERSHEIVLWHRGFAYAASAMVVLVGLSGWFRWRIHTRLWPVFLPLYTTTYALALCGYWP